MVVDLRYHVASLVAVFLALGLGVLVGASLFGDVQGSVLQEQLLAAVEREMELLRADRRRMASELESVTSERDLYIDVTTELTAALMRDSLLGKSLALIALGNYDDTLESLESLVQNAGASVFAKLRVDADLSPGDDPLRLPEDVAVQDVGAVIALSGSPQQYGTVFSDTVSRLKSLGITKVIALTIGEDWQSHLEDTGVTYISRADSPIGKLSTLLLLGSEEVGAYGTSEAMWPRHLLPR